MRGQFFRRSVAVATALWASLAVAQGDLWDTLMTRATEAAGKWDFARAREAAVRAADQALYESADRRVTSLALLARIFQEEGDLRNAEGALSAAIDAVDDVPGLVGTERSILHNNLGVVLDLLGDLPGAELNYRAALAIQKTSSSVPAEDRISLLVNLAGLLERRNDPKAAELLYGEGERLGPDRRTIIHATLQNNMAALMMRQGDVHGARNRFLRTLEELPEGSGDKLLRASVLHNLGTSELELGDLAAAGAHLEEAEAIRYATLGSMHLDTVRTLASRAAVAEREGKLQVALAKAREAVSIVSGVLATTSGTRAAAVSAQTRRDWRETFATYLRVLQGTGLPEPVLIREALRAIQTIKHGDLARVFAGTTSGAHGELDKRVRRLEDLSERLRGLEATLAQTLQSEQENTARIREVRLAIRSLREQMEAMQSSIATDFPRYHELVAGRIASLESIQEVLGAHEAVLSYFTAETETFVLALSRDSAKMATVRWDRRSLSNAVRAVRRSVDPGLGDDSFFATGPAAELYRNLVAPVSSVVGGKSVWLIVPDGPLESLPFSLLLEADRPSVPGGSWRDFPWVVSKHATVTLPSLGVMAQLRAESAVQGTAEPLIAFADPVFDAGNDRAAVPGTAARRRNPASTGMWSYRGGSRPAGTDDGTGRPSPENSVRLSYAANPDWIRQLAPLPETATEAALVAAALGGGELFVREQATESNVKASDLTRYRNVLFATHAIMAGDISELGEPALVLTPPGVPSAADDGLLSASEIAQLRLNADWVVLSACNTAASDGTPGADGFSGLAKAFFHAGARNLLVSHWSVVSDSTVRLSTGTFAALSADPGHGKAFALQRSMLELMAHEKRFAHPMYWAPFVLVGDGR